MSAPPLAAPAHRALASISPERRVSRPDEDLTPKDAGGGESEAQGILGQQALVGDPAHPVRAERYGPSIQSASLARVDPEVLAPLLLDENGPLPACERGPT